MENARTLRFDLTSVSQEKVLEFLQAQTFVKAIVYHEIATQTGKPHLQGWCLFGSKAEADNFSKNRLRAFKKSNGLENAATSCATIKKDSYFVYTAKDKNCVWSVNVSDEERIANEEKSHPKRGSVVDMVVEEFKASGEEPYRKSVAKAILKIYLDQKKPMYMHTIRAQTLLAIALIGGESELEALAEQV